MRNLVQQLKHLSLAKHKRYPPLNYSHSVHRRAKKGSTRLLCQQGNKRVFYPCSRGTVTEEWTQLLVLMFLSRFWCSTPAMRVNPWQTMSHILAGDKRTLVLPCEVNAGAVGGDGCWVQPQAGEPKSQQGKQTTYLKMYQKYIKSLVTYQFPQTVQGIS